MPLRPVSVFISSTCYELADLRYELADALRADGFVVKMSEDPNSAFCVDPLDDSIGSCLSNVEGSDVVVCIIDRRYGGIVRAGPNAGHSATHLEIRRARETNKPLFFFLREPAARDYEQLRANPAYDSKWVEPSRAAPPAAPPDWRGRLADMIGGPKEAVVPPVARTKWIEFVRYVSELPKHPAWSNWYDSFKTVVDLKPLVRKRLADHFPNQLGTVALSAERVLRVVLVRGATGTGDVRGHVRNVGPGPAYSVRHGSRVGAREVAPAYRGGLSEAEDLLDNMQEPRYLTTAPGAADGDERVVFCEYENRFGDAYRVDVPLFRPDPARNWQFGAERFLVRVGTGEWLLVSDANAG